MAGGKAICYFFLVNFRLRGAEVIWIQAGHWQRLNSCEPFVSEDCEVAAGESYTTTLLLTLNHKRRACIDQNIDHRIQVGEGYHTAVVNITGTAVQRVAYSVKPGCGGCGGF